MTVSRRSLLVASSTLLPGLFVSYNSSAQEKTQPPSNWDKTYEVIVIGAGGAGLTAAVVAKENGAEPVVLEKMMFPGGNTNISGGGFNAAVTEDSKVAKVEDSPKLHAEQTLAAGDHRADPELVRTLTEGAPVSVQWLKDHGLRFQKGIYQIYGGLWPRCRNPDGEKGYGYIKVLLAQCKKQNIPVLTGHKVVRVIREQSNNGRVLGVVVKIKGKQENWRATKGVVAAAGGFAANAQMCSLYDPRLTKLNTSNQPGASGEVMVAMQNIGALTTGLDYIQCIPGAAPGLKKSLNLHQCPEYTIFTNKLGKRFISEDSRRDVICNALLLQPDQVGFEISGQAGLEANNKFQKSRNDACLKEGLMVKGKTIEELANKLGLDANNLRATIEAFNQACDSKRDVLGRASHMLGHKIEAPYYGGPFGMVRHHTMGGVRITPNAEVLDRDCKVIPGLYAAGEVTGGIHGSNRVGGNAIADVFTFGRIAGEQVAKN